MVPKPPLCNLTTQQLQEIRCSWVEKVEKGKRLTLPVQRLVDSMMTADFPPICRPALASEFVSMAVAQGARGFRSFGRLRGCSRVRVFAKKKRPEPQVRKLVGTGALPGATALPEIVIDTLQRMKCLLSIIGSDRCLTSP